MKDGLAWLSLGTLAVCMALISSQIGHPAAAFGGMVAIDTYACFWKLLLCFVAGLTVLLSYSYLKEERLYFGEYYAFVLLSLCGMMVMVSATDLLAVYLGTELMSLSLYVMAGLKRSEPRSLEASAKYFVLGAFSSGILLYGISLLYGATGSTRLPAIADAVAGRSDARAGNGSAPGARPARADVRRGCEAQVGVGGVVRNTARRGLVARLSSRAAA